MPTNQELFIIRHTRLKNMAQADAARSLAEEFQLNEDGVRGRLQKSDTIGNRVALAKFLAWEVDGVSPSVQRQHDVINRSNASFDLKQSKVRAKGEGAVVFLSDPHAPYTRWDAWDLALQIVAYVQPDYVTGLNDFMDNHAFAHWEDRRSQSGRTWTVDEAYRDALEIQMYESISAVAPDTTLLGVTGNHDNWYFAYHREKAQATAEGKLARYMEQLEKVGLLQFTRGYRQENVVDLSPGLSLWHGQFAAKLPTTNARNTLAQFMEDGISRSVVVGHTHRPVHVPGEAIGYSGRNFYNNGCLCRLDNLPYMKRRPKGWGLSVTVVRYDPNGREERGVIVHMREKGNSLVADFEGKRFTAELDTSQPDDYR